MSDQRPRCAFDPEYPDAERCAQTLENCEDDLLTEAAFVRWQGREIERLTAALHAQPGPVSMDDVEWAGKVHLAEAIRERDELRRQLDPMGEYASAEELIAALHAEKAEDEAMKLDARRYRDWLRGGANIPPESTRWARWEVRYWNGRHWITLFAEQMDTAIDAAMGLTRPAEES